jgi:hypothetical protein
MMAEQATLPTSVWCFIAFLDKILLLMAVARLERIA